MRRDLGAMMVSGLVLATAGLVLASVRATDPPAAEVVALGTGAVASHGSQVWKWAGSSDCGPDADAVPIQRTTSAGWVGASVPLVNVYRISFGSKRNGIAVGTTPTCGRGVAVTVDGGVTWRYRPKGPALVDATMINATTVWGITREGGIARPARYELSGGMLTLAEEPVAAPCDAGDGSPRLVSAWTEQDVVVMCEQETINQRLLARTRTAGAGWDRLTDNRPLTGLDGSGRIYDLVVAGESQVWAVISEAECAEGQIRRSDNEGLTFERLTCPSESAEIEQVLSIAFSSPEQGLMLAVVKGNGAEVYETKDGGATWTPSSAGAI